MEIAGRGRTPAGVRAIDAAKKRGRLVPSGSGRNRGPFWRSPSPSMVAACPDLPSRHPRPPQLCINGVIHPFKPPPPPPDANLCAFHLLPAPAPFKRGPSTAPKKQKKSKLLQEFLGLPQIGCARRDADKEPEETANLKAATATRRCGAVRDVMQTAANSPAETRACGEQRLQIKREDKAGGESATRWRHKRR